MSEQHRSDVIQAAAVILAQLMQMNSAYEPNIPQAVSMAVKLVDEVDEALGDNEDTEGSE